MPFFRQGARLPRILGTLLVFCLLGPVPALAGPGWPPSLEGRVLPVEQIEPGMQGVAYTVIQGTQVEPFDVTFLGVLPGAGPAGDLLLVETSGPLIDRTGGIVSGMSGSPVYVDGRLVGAIAYGFGYADHRVGLVTPIGDMVEVLNRIEEPSDEESPPPSSPRPRGVGAEVPRRVALAPDARTARHLQGRLTEGTLVLVPLTTPLLAAGFGSRTLNLLSRWADGLPGGPFLTVPTGSSTRASTASAGEGGLQPGSAFGVQLLRGDVELSALGTLTWTDGRSFLGFGHPFLNRGSVAFAATGASILRTVTSVEMPFKIGVATDLIGTLSQDRGAAVGGRLGPLPRMVEVNVDVVDLDRAQDGESRKLRFWSVEDPWLLPDLVAIGALQALDRGIDRIGPGTARIRFSVEADGLQQPLVRDNMFFSETDISALALVEVMEGIQLLAANPFREVGLRRVDVTARITPEPQTAQIVAVRPAAGRVRAGESVLIEVELQPYRGPREQKVIRLAVPSDTSPGKVSVTVRGGYFAGPSRVIHAEILADEEAPPPEEEADLLPEGTSLEDALESFRTRERNYELVVEFYPPFAPYGETPPNDEPAAPAGEEEGGPPDPLSEPSEADEAGDAAGAPLPDEGKPVQARLATDYVIQGSDQFELEIAAPAPPQETEAPGATGSPPGS